MKLLFLGIFLTLDVVSAGPLANPCKQSGLHALSDNSAEFYACHLNADGQFEVKYFKCEKEHVFNHDVGSCVQKSTFDLEVRATSSDGNNDVENPTFPTSEATSTTKGDIVKPTVPTSKPTGSADSGDDTTEQPETTADMATSEEPETTDAPVKPVTTPSTSEKPETTDATSTSEQAETTDAPEKPATTPSTPEKPETTVATSTSEKPETTDATSTSEQAETTDAPSTSEKPETTDATSTPEKPETTDAPSTSEKPETTDATSTSEEPETTDVPTTIASTVEPASTDEPNTTTQAPFNCPDQGFFPIYNSCDKFAYCASVNNEIVYVLTTCPKGQQFNYCTNFCDKNFDCKADVEC